MTSGKIKYLSRSERETRLAGTVLGRWARPGDVLALVGELGTGKTCLVQGIALGLDVPASSRVRSPSFVILHTYAGRCPVHHLDLYRIRGPEELEDLDWRDVLYGDGVCVIEWADRMGNFLPARRLDVALFHSTEESRWIQIRPSAALEQSRWQDLVGSWEAANLPGPTPEPG
jgi:tRNA threonylcarbamoyladenosine biosynthesis protein TsaE